MYGLIVGFAVTAFASTAAAQVPSTLDGLMPSFQIPKVLPPCGLNTATHRLPQKTGLLLGLQITEDCLHTYPQLDLAGDVEDLAGLTVRQALDRLVALAPTYEWREMDGVAVIRPNTAWNDSRDALNMRVQPFEAQETYLAVAVSSLLNTPVPNGFPIGPHGLANRPFRMAFPGGTLLEALNAVIRAHKAAGWRVGLDKNPPPNPRYSVNESTPLFVLGMAGTDIKPGFTVDTPLARLRAVVNARPQAIRPEQRSALESRLKSFVGHKLRLTVNYPNPDTKERAAVLRQAFTKVGIDLQMRDERNARIPPSFSFGVPSNYRDWAFLRAVATALVETGIAEPGTCGISRVITDTATLFVTPG